MNQYLRVILALMMLLAAGVAAALPIADVVAQSDKWNQQSISMEGHLCVDGSEVYLASTDECDEIKEEQEGGFRITLVLSNRTQYLQAVKIKSGSKVIVTGVFRIPPPGALRMTRGILLGYSIVASSISEFKK